MLAVSTLCQNIKMQFLPDAWLDSLGQLSLFLL